MLGNPSYPEPLTLPYTHTLRALQVQVVARVSRSHAKEEVALIWYRSNQFPSEVKVALLIKMVS